MLQRACAVARLICYYVVRPGLGREEHVMLLATARGAVAAPAANLDDPCREYRAHEPDVSAHARTLRERVRQRVEAMLDRLDERWDDGRAAGRWSGSCWFRHAAYLPETLH